MQFDEFKTIVKVLKGNFTSKSFIPDAEALQVWYQAFKNYDYNTVMAGATRLILTCKYDNPKIADMVDAITSGVTAKEWANGWGEVQKAIGGYGRYRETEAIASLSPETAEAVRLIGWQSICDSENVEITRAQFRQAYEGVVRTEKEKMTIPENVRRRLQESVIKQLGGGENVQ